MKKILVYNMRSETKRQSVALSDFSWKASGYSNFPLSFVLSANDHENPANIFFLWNTS